MIPGVIIPAGSIGTGNVDEVLIGCVTVGGVYGLLLLLTMLLVNAMFDSSSVRTDGTLWTGSIDILWGNFHSEGYPFIISNFLLDTITFLVGIYTL